jgi:hypothetical protein
MIETEYGDVERDEIGYCIFNQNIEIEYEWKRVGCDSYVSGNVIAIKYNNNKKKEVEVMNTIKSLKDLNQEQLLAVVEEYDKYIQNANDENRYEDKWYPVCIEEFLNNDYEQIIEDAEIEAEENLKSLLASFIEKINLEFDVYKTDLFNETSDYIYDKSYETAFKKEIVGFFTDRDNEDVLSFFSVGYTMEEIILFFETNNFVEKLYEFFMKKEGFNFCSWNAMEDLILDYISENYDFKGNDE